MSKALRIGADLVAPIDGADVIHGRFVYYADRFDATGDVVVKVKPVKDAAGAIERSSRRFAKTYGVPPCLVDVIDLADVPVDIRPDDPAGMPWPPRLSKAERLLCGAEQLDNMARLSIPAFERTGRSRHDVGHDPVGMRQLGRRVDEPAATFAQGVVQVVRCPRVRGK